MSKLDKLFGSAAQVKIMRLFMFNPSLVFDSGEITKRTKVRPASVKKVMSDLEKSGLVKKKMFSKRVSMTKGRGKKKKTVTRSKRLRGWTLNDKFQYLSPLRNLLMPTDALTNKQIEKKFAGAGRIKLIITSGVFLHEPDARVDLVVVGENLKAQKLRNVISDLEAHIGAELAYAALDTDEFKYRYNINDKLVRDILDFPHEKIVNKLNI